MKNSLLLSGLFFGVSLLLPTVSEAQWETDVRLTNDAATSVTGWSNGWSVAASGEVVHVVWYDNRDGNNEIYYKRSPDGGISWGADTRLTNNSANSWNPSVTVSGSVVRVVWEDNRDGNNEIYYKFSPDGGISWGPDMRLTDDSGSSRYPSATLFSYVAHVVWMDDRDGNFEVYYKRSPDGGISWSGDRRLTNNSAGSQDATIAVYYWDVHVVWADDRDGNYEIYYKHSTNEGVSWGPDTRLTNNSGNSWSPSVTVSGSVVHVVWVDYRDGNYEIYYKRSPDGGISWGADTRLTNNTARSEVPSVTASGSVVHVVWGDGRDGNFNIYYKRSTDGGISWGPDTRLTNKTGDESLPFVTVSGSVVHVVWTATGDGNYEIYYKRNPTGNPTSVITLGDIVPHEYVLFQNYPNPFNPSTKVHFSVPRSGFVGLRVYDILGQEVATLVNGETNPGNYEVTLDATGWPSGLYFYRLQAASFTETKKLLLLK
jgi:hypothetical protein